MEARGPRERREIRRKRETPVFVPLSKDSALRNRLQEVDDVLSEATNTLAVRFVERCGGGTLIGLLGCSNPWVKD